MADALRLVVLAAGAGARLGLAKALARLDDGAGEGPALTPLASLLAAGAALEDPAPLVVTGPDHAAIARAAPRDVELVANADWRAGRTGSLALAARRRTGQDLCVAPVDVPLVPPEVFRALRAAWRAAGAPARGWLAPFVRDGAGAPRFGHPVVIGRALASELERISADRPLRELRERAEQLLAVEVASPAILDDLDTRADLRALRERLRARSLGRQEPHT